MSKGGGGAREERTKAAYELTGKSDKLGRKEIRGSLAFLVRYLYSVAVFCVKLIRIYRYRYFYLTYGRKLKIGTRG